MTKEEYLKEAARICVSKSDASEFYYVEPLWEIYLKAEAGEYPEGLTHEETLEVLKLVVEKLNVSKDRSRVLINWIYDVLTANIDPAMIEEENELVKNIVEYMKMNKNIEEREKKLQEQEQVVSGKKNISKLLMGMRFSKR